MAALIRKQQLASYVTTQMCFSVPTLVSWIRDIRARGVELPVVVGVPGVVDRMRLLRVAAKIGVGPSVRYLRSNPGGLRLLRTFSPDPIIGSLLALPQLRDLGLAGLHVFTFNQLDTTWDWYRRVARLD
jgi:methylenetetrahydrofolate reductase (NADPH)